MSTDDTAQYPALHRTDNATDWRTHRTADVYSRCTPHNATFLAAERDSESTALIAANYTAVIATILSALEHTDAAADCAALDPSLAAAHDAAKRAALQQAVYPTKLATKHAAYQPTFQSTQCSAKCASYHAADVSAIE